MRIIGIVILAGGLLALAYGRFGANRQTHDIVLGNIDIAVSDRQQIGMAIWVGAALVIVGGGLILTNRR